MRGYKGMNADMTCRGFKFEVGKEYTVRGNIKLCKNGFHFCERLKDVFWYYAPEKASRYFVVETAGKVLIEGSKAVAKTLRIVREVVPQEVWRAYYDAGFGNGSDKIPSVIVNGGGCGYGNTYGQGYGGGCYNGTLIGTGRGNGPIDLKSRKRFNKIGIFK